MSGKGKMYAQGVALIVACLLSGVVASAQSKRPRTSPDEARFGPVVSAYLGYLRAQQEVVDDRVSRHEISQTYYRRNSNRIRALRQMAVRIAGESHNDYLPELEAVAADEFDTLFFDPLPKAESLRVGETLNYTFRFLGMVASGREKFYLFARLDPYEQAELRKKAEADAHAASSTHTTGQPASTTLSPAPVSETTTSRPRRVNSP